MADQSNEMGMVDHTAEYRSWAAKANRATEREMRDAIERAKLAKQLKEAKAWHIATRW